MIGREHRHARDDLRASLVLRGREPVRRGAGGLEARARRGTGRQRTRDGAPPIDLVDGDQLADKLKELSLGIKTELVEKVSIDENWYKNI